MPWLSLFAWVIAAAWWWNVIAAVRGLPLIPDLLKLREDEIDGDLPSVTVVVPARDEAAAITQTLDTLAAQTHKQLKVIAIDDRSTDGTGALMDMAADRASGRIEVIHLHGLPDGWTGKAHALHAGAQRAESEWLLFTDGDGKWAPTAVARAVAMAERCGADHFVTVPTMEVQSVGEGMLLGFFQTISLWVSRPWRAGDPQAKRDVVGIGAFNMIRRSAYERIGGFEALRMEILEDMRLARNVKAAGLRSQVAFGRDLLRLHWAAGVRGLVRVMTKNMFAGFRFRVLFCVAACLWFFAVSVMPVGLSFLHATRVPALLIFAAMLAVYLLYRKQSGISAWYMMLAPVGACVMIFTLLWSMFTTLQQGGVEWRGTFYPLAELRERAGPMW